MTYCRCRNTDGQREGERVKRRRWLGVSRRHKHTSARCLCSAKHGVEIVIDVTDAQCRRENRTAWLPTTTSGLDDRRSGVLFSVYPLVIELFACLLQSSPSLSAKSVGGGR